jgi:hypothetical protein
MHKVHELVCSLGDTVAQVERAYTRLRNTLTVSKVQIRTEIYGS